MVIHVSELDVHIVWQYIHIHGIWQEDDALKDQLSRATGIDTLT